MRKLLKVVAWLAGGLLGLVVLGLGVLFGINATDEPLSDEVQALLRRPPPPAPSERNGYLDFLALGAPADAPTFATGVAQLAALNGKSDVPLLGVKVDARLMRCRYGDYLSCVAAEPSARELLQSHAVLVERYLAMRRKPEFIDLQVPGSPDDSLPSFATMTAGHRLLMTRVALDFSAGRRAAAIGDLETEFAFYRTMAAGSRTLLAKLVAFAQLDSNALVAADMARRIPPADKASRARLAALLRPPTKAELDLTPVLREEQARVAGWMQTRRFVRMSDATYESTKEFGARRPWWDPIAPWLYRPHYSVNRYVARSNVMLSVAERPASEFLAAQAESRARAQQLDPALWKLFVVSPAGTFHYIVAADDFSDYIGRVHGHTAMQSLAALQVRLRNAGLRTPAAVERALAGPLGAAHPNPFTGKPMELDAKAGALGFACDPRHLTGVVRDAIFINGRVALPL